MITKVTLRNLVAHKVRLALTALSVVLGVAFVAGTLVFTDTMGRQFDDLFSRIDKDVAVQVRAKKVLDTEETEGSSSVPGALLRTVRGVPGVASADGEVAGFAAVVGRDGKVVGGSGPPQIGASWGEGERMLRGRGPVRAGEVALDEKTAQKAGVRVGDPVRVLIRGPVQTARVVGVVDAGDLLGATVVSFDMATAQRLLLRPGEFSDIVVTARDGVTETALRDRIGRALPSPAYEAITGTQLREENKSDVAQILSFVRTFLLVFAVISIFVGAFIIFNTFSMLVAQRSRELAVLRALGASRGQVTRGVLGEAVGVGIVGATLGLGAGAGLAVALRELFNAAGAEFGGSLVFTLKPVLWAYAVGIVVTVVAAYLPARRAARVPPVAAMRDDVALPRRSMRFRVIAGGLLTAVGAVLTGLGLGDAPLALLGVGAGMVFLGVAMLAPVISRPVVRVLSAAYPALFRTPGRLARQNALRNPRRTAATASALMIGLALVSAINVLSSSAKASVVDQVDKTFAADYLVAPNSPAGFSPDEPARALAAVPGVATVTAVYRGRFRVGADQQSFFATRTPAELVRTARMRIVAGSSDVGRDGMLVDEPTARSAGLRPGSVLTARFGDGRDQPIRVAGVYARNQLLGERIVALPALLAHSEHPAGAVVLVTATRADDATKRAVEQAVAGYPNLTVQDRSDVKESAQRSIDQLVVLLTVLLTLSIIIAALGIINTLALSVIERTREIGLLRAVGTSRRQTRRMIRLESVVLAVFGAVLGMAIGVAFGVAVRHAVRDQGVNVLSVPVPTLLVYLVLSAVIGVVAAAWPAWRASRLDVLKAIAYE